MKKISMKLAKTVGTCCQIVANYTLIPMQLNIIALEIAGPEGKMFD